MYFMKPYIAARAQLVTFMLVILAIYMIEKFLQTKKKRYAVGLIVIPTLIANLHVAVWPFYFILFLPYIGEYIFSFLGNANYIRFLKIKFWKRKLKSKKITAEKASNIQAKIASLEAEIIIQKENTTKRRSHAYKVIIERNNNVKALILIMILCAFTGLLTPLGDTPYTYLVKTLQGNTMDNINEHLPLTLINAKDFLCLIIVFLGILLFSFGVSIDAFSTGLGLNAITTNQMFAMAIFAAVSFSFTALYSASRALYLFF